MEADRQVEITDDGILSKIHSLRGYKVMLDSDLAELYQVETKRLKESVRRNIDRFPADFLFELTADEVNSLRTQIASSKKGRGGTRYLPMAFTEQGVAMLSSVLKSETAIQVNIFIIRVFTKMRQMLLSQADVLLRLEKIEGKLSGQGREIDQVFRYLKKLVNIPPPGKRARIGFRRKGDPE